MPLRLAGKNLPPVLEVRGEVYMTNSDLVRLNEQQTRRGRAALCQHAQRAPPAASGCSIRGLCAERRLRLFCHGVGYVEGLEGRQRTWSFWPSSRGYGLPPTPQRRVLRDVRRGGRRIARQLIERLHELDFEVDGLVLKVNRFDQRERLGSTTKSPRWVIAYKFEKYEATTRVNDIRVQVGKTGAITPVADLEPVELAGTVVSRASLHNADEIERKDVRVGDMVVVEKAGKVIPHIVRVEKHEREGELPTFHFPTHCPECDTPAGQGRRGRLHPLPQPELPGPGQGADSLFRQPQRHGHRGAGRQAGRSTGRRPAWCKRYGDLYRLTLEQLTNLERMGQKVVREPAGRHRGQQDARAGPAAQRAVDPARRRARGHACWPSISASMEALAAGRRRGAGRSAGDRPDHRRKRARISAQRLRPADDRRSAAAGRRHDRAASAHGRRATGKLAGKTLVVTGTLSKYRRDEIQELIAAARRPGRPRASRRTPIIVVAGEKAGSKLDKAQKLGVTILDEAALDRLLEN